MGGIACGSQLHAEEANLHCHHPLLTPESHTASFSFNSDPLLYFPTLRRNKQNPIQMHTLC